MRLARGNPLLTVGVLLLSALAGAARAADLEVSVQDVADDDGHVLVAVCTSETFLGAQCPHTAKAPATEGVVEVTVSEVPPGTYAVQAFHDANDNLDLDRNFLGMPEEGMGFSNDAPMRFGPPDYEDAAIEIDTRGVSTELTMRYFD